MIYKFKKFVNEMQATCSRSAKMEVLDKYRDDPDIRYLLLFIYNPYITTGISDKKLSRNVEACMVNLREYFKLAYELRYADDLKLLLEFVKMHNTGSDTVISVVQSFCRDLPLDVRDLFCDIVTKNLQLGVDAKTINKVIPGLIPEFSVMLANKYFDNPSVVDGKHFVLTTKIDGGRIIALKEDNNVSFYTRAGQKYEGLVDLEQELAELPFNNICFDGEITLLDRGFLTSKDQYKETMKITRKDGEKHGVKMLVFDVMTASQFRNKNCDTPYYERRNRLDRLFETHHMTFFEKLPVLYDGSDTSQILDWLNYNVDNDEEGVMINIADAPYEFKRTNALLKVKRMNDIDLEIIGFEEGSNRHAGRLGALLVSYKDNIVKVGSGFSDELRDEIWAHRDDWLGRTITVQYFEETTNQSGGVSLRFPVYLDYRTDK